MFVRTKRVDGKEYHQLVENVRENGKHVQRVVLHLGKHTSVEEALEAAREDLKTLERSKLRTLATRYAKEATVTGKVLRHPDGYFINAIETYHDGEIPSLEEALKLAGEWEEVPHSGEWEETDYGISLPLFVRKDRTPEEVAYCESFKGHWWEHRRGRPDHHGHTHSHTGFSAFLDYLERWWKWMPLANKRTEEFNAKKDRLEAKIERLENVW